MRISHGETMMKLSDVDKGEVFMWKGEVYIKLVVDSVNLRTGELILSFGNNEPVTIKPDALLHVEGGR